LDGTHPVFTQVPPTVRRSIITAERPLVRAANAPPPEPIIEFVANPAAEALVDRAEPRPILRDRDLADLSRVGHHVGDGGSHHLPVAKP
jgi:hypothetical protein